LTDNAAEVRAEYAYAPYGSTAKVGGNLEANFGFTGYFRHLISGLDLSLYRAYDTGKAQWLSRDPIVKNGVNLYNYCSDDPLNSVDRLGLDPSPDDLTVTPGLAPEARDPVGRIIQIKAVENGAAKNVYVRRNGKWYKACPDEALQLGDELKTDKNTVSAIEFVIGGRVGINKDAQVEIVTERSVRDSDFNMKRVIFRKINLFTSPPEPLEIQTNGGVLGGIKG
jgi:RHS repeat-associated protein